MNTWEWFDNGKNFFMEEGIPTVGLMLCLILLSSLNLMALKVLNVKNQTSLCNPISYHFVVIMPLCSTASFDCAVRRLTNTTTTVIGRVMLGPAKAINVMVTKTNKFFWR